MQKQMSKYSKVSVFICLLHLYLTGLENLNFFLILCRYVLLVSKELMRIELLEGGKIAISTDFVCWFVCLGKETESLTLV